MAKECSICSKRSKTGNSISRRGMAKKKGGAGRKITGITLRKFKPNLQRVKIATPHGKRSALVCTKCLKSGKVKKAA